MRKLVQTRSFLSLMLLFGAVGSAAARTPGPQVSPPESGAAVVARASRLRAAHKPEEAVSLLRRYLQAAPDDAAALLTLGEALLDLGKVEDAGAAMAQSLAIEPQSRAANLALGKLLQQQHKDPEAMDRFETVLSRAPGDPDARKGEVAASTELALSARRDGHPELALEALRHACAKLPDDPQLQFDLGIEAEELGAFPEAEQALHAAQRLDPKNVSTLYALARLETEDRHPAEAERDYQAYLAARPNDASAHFGLGYLYAAEQRVADARREFETSLRLQPHQTESYYQLGQLDLDAHNDAAARAQFQKVLASNPDHPGALTGMGELALRAKDYATAEQLLARAEKADSNYKRPHYYRGLALARLGRTAEAQEELKNSDGREHAGASPAADAGAAGASTPRPPD